jgi:mono/diheme cytochrome c family protein
MRVQARVALLLSAAVFAGVVSVAVLKAQGPQAPDGPPPVITAAREQQLFQQFCYACHSERAKVAGLDSAKKLTLDTLDTSNVRRAAKTWELVARKLRAGMMPPAEMRRPDPATYQSMVAWLEGELDRDAPPYTPSPGLHRLNRTEYANSILDLLDLPIDPA